MDEFLESETPPFGHASRRMTPGLLRSELLSSKDVMTQVEDSPGHAAAQQFRVVSPVPKRCGEGSARIVLGYSSETNDKRPVVPDTKDAADDGGPDRAVGEFAGGLLS
jgi:hypothetical protein